MKIDTATLYYTPMENHKFPTEEQIRTAKELIGNFHRIDFEDHMEPGSTCLVDPEKWFINIRLHEKREEDERLERDGVIVIVEPPVQFEMMGGR